MKLIVYTDKTLKKINPREVRDFIGSLVEDEFKEKIFWHKHIPAPVIISRESSRSLALISAYSDIELFEQLKNVLNRRKKIKVNGRECKIVRIVEDRYNFRIPQLRFSVFRTLTPVIITSCSDELEDYLKVKDKKELLEKYTAEVIKKTVIHHVKFYLNREVDMEDFYIKFIEKYETGRLEYKNGVFLNYVKGVFASNYSLPEFVGYRTNFGYGKLKML